MVNLSLNGTVLLIAHVHASSSIIACIVLWKSTVVNITNRTYIPPDITKSKMSSYDNRVGHSVKTRTPNRTVDTLQRIDRTGCGT